MPRQIIPICFMFNDDYHVPAQVAISSMLDNISRQHTYHLHILYTDQSISAATRKSLTRLVACYPDVSIYFRNVELDKLDCWENLFKAHFSKEILIKLALPSLFPEYERIICSDVDVVFSGDVSKALTDYDLTGYYFSGVRSLELIDIFVERQRYPKEIKARLKGGIGAGFLVYNLAALRSHGVEKAFIRNLLICQGVITQPEQDIINLTIPRDKIRYLPLKFMFCTYMYSLIRTGKFDLRCSGEWRRYIFDDIRQYVEADAYNSREEILEALEAPVQVHYATGTKPWNTRFCYRKLLWLRYLFTSQIKKIFYRPTHVPPDTNNSM